MTSAGAPEPEFEAIADSFKVTLFSIVESDPGGVNGGVNELLAFIENNPGKNTKQIQEQLRIPKRTLERRLRKLRDQKKNEFRGPPKTGGYYASGQ
ncbi:MAG: hypothetical protein JRJ39_02265 [Deltaproteobacteria bacterium]|nr:hypothetical protein [Deltaproteobacteria bacterium]